MRERWTVCCIISVMAIERLVTTAMQFCAGRNKRRASGPSLLLTNTYCDETKSDVDWMPWLKMKAIWSCSLSIDSQHADSAVVLKLMSYRATRRLSIRWIPKPLVGWMSVSCVATDRVCLLRCSYSARGLRPPNVSLMSGWLERFMNCGTRVESLGGVEVRVLRLVITSKALRVEPAAFLRRPARPRSGAGGCWMWSLLGTCTAAVLDASMYLCRFPRLTLTYAFSGIVVGGTGADANTSFTTSLSHSNAHVGTAIRVSRAPGQETLCSCHSHF